MSPRQMQSAGMGAILAWVIICQVLWYRAYQHFGDPDHRFRPLDVFRAEVFTPRGNELRRRALIATLLLLATLVVLGLWHAWQNRS